MYTIYFSGDSVSTSDASEAVTVYWEQVDAGTRPAVFRDGDLIVHINTCEDCWKPVLMTRHYVAAYVGAFGELDEGVLCEHCIDRMIDDE